MLYKTNNECFSFVQWCEYVHSLNRTFHLSTHEHICTIALINIHYVYNMDSLYGQLGKEFGASQWASNVFLKDGGHR